MDASGSTTPSRATSRDSSVTGKAAFTIRHLLTHVSGLRPDVDLHPWTGYDAAIELAKDEVPTSAPGETFVYSDINFFLLGDIVARVTGQSLDAYLKARVFGPLGHDARPASFRRSHCCRASRRPSVAPSRMRGRASVPTRRRCAVSCTIRPRGAWAASPVTPDSSAPRAICKLFARMLLGKGRLGTTRVLSAASVAAMTSPQTPPGMTSVRGLGWDIDTSFSSNRGDLFPVGTSYGHTGFTGTSLWIDPSSNSYVIFLSSRLHPDGTGDVGVLRSRIATVAAAAITNEGNPVVSAFRRTTLPAVGKPARACPDWHRCFGARRLQAAARQARRAHHESHRSFARWRGDDRSASEGAGCDVSVAVQS